ncbi:MAG: hypothetical protein RJA42_465 [Bacteroidota bacterium]
MVKYLKIFVKTILYGLLGIFLLIFAAILLLRAPINQTLLANYLAPKVEKAIGYPVKMKGIQIKFFDELSVYDLEVKDPWGAKMIQIEQLDVNFSISHLFLQPGKPSLDYTRLTRPNVHLIFEKKTGKMNIEEFIIRLENWITGGVKTVKKGPSSIFTIPEAEVIDGSFSLDDNTRKSEATRRHFDISHFTLGKVYSKVKNFYIKNDTLGLQAIGLRTKDPLTGFDVKSLNTVFMISDRQMRFDQLDLRFNDSRVTRKFVVNYRDMSSMTRWITDVDMQADFNGALVKGEDLGRFVEAMYEYKGMYRLKGALSGTVAKLNLKKFELGFGAKSVLRGDFGFKGLPDVDKTDMDFTMRSSLFYPEDLGTYITKSAAENMVILGPVAFDGLFKGNNTVFRTAGKLKTGLGYVEADVKMNLKDSMAFSRYDGKIKLQKFKLGKLLGMESILGTLDAEGELKGNGFAKKSANIDFDGKISEIYFNQYLYHKIALKGNFQKQLFKGEVVAKDTNLVGTMSGLIDLRGAKPVYKMQGEITHSNLHTIRLMDPQVSLSTDFELDFKGDRFDDLEGRMVFYNSKLRTPNKPDLHVELVTLTSENGPGQKRHYKLTSDLISAEISGEFTPSILQAHLRQVAEEYALYFQKGSDERWGYYATRKHEIDTKYKADFTVICHRADPILARFFPSVQIGENTVFSGNISKGRTLSLSLEAYPDTLVLGGYHFYQSVFSFQSSKFLGAPEVSSSLVFTSRKQQLNFLTPTENFKLDALWDQDRINFGLDFKQQGEENLAHLAGAWNFEDEGLSLKFKDTYFRILGQDWAMDPANKITIQGQEWKADRVVVSNQNQSISLQGSLSTDTTETIKLRANHFQLSTLKPLFSTKTQGELNGEIAIQDWYNHTRLDSWLLVDSLRLNTFFIGNLQGVGTYLADEKAMDLNLNLNRLGESVMSLTGAYKPFEEDQKLNIKAELNQTDLQILEPFTSGIFSNLKGSASGNLHIGGLPTKPEITGDMVFSKAGAVFDYLKTSMSVSDTVNFTPRHITAKNWTVVDPEGNKALVNTSLYFPEGKPFELDIQANLDHYKLLNTTREPNSIYYGLGYATGPMRVSGTVDNLLVSADLKSEKGTRLFIPLDREEDVTQGEDYSFVSELNTLNIDQNLSTVSSKLQEDGITLDLRLALTPEAYGEVQFDAKKGDVMRMYGSGAIKMNLDKKGAFKMVGDYAIDQGDYTFTLQNLINKKFAIQRGSKITWTGDPLEANVNIKAIYTQYASLFPILLDTTNKGNMPEFKRRYPVDVTISLQDRLMSPTVNFDIGIRDYPKDMTLNGAVTAFANRIKTDDQELTRQVSNLLLFGQLVSPFGGSGIALGNLMGNFTEMLSNQLSNLASKINKDLDISVSLGGGILNQDILSNLQLRASYNFNDRLRITRSGGFTDARNQTSPQILLGDWALEWFVRPDGSLRLKTYNRNVQTTILGSFNSYQINQTLGASLLYNKGFNTFFWQKKK